MGSGLPLAEFAGIDGFIPGSRASLMLDVVFVAMFVVIPVMGWSVRLVRQRRYGLHKRVQLWLGAVLLAAITAFEIDIRVNGWRRRASESPYFGEGDFNWVLISLGVHLFFAIPTALIWAFVIVAALRKMPRPPRPSPHSRAHKLWGWIAVVEMAATAVTGWIFYALAFLA